MQSKPVLALATLAVLLAWQPAVTTAADVRIPVFQVDPYWPKLPDGWLLGGGAGVTTDQHDNVWIIHRPATVTEQFPCCRPAPPVMEFDPSGKLLQSWGGPGQGYEWPLEKDEHGIFVDYKDNVWIGARGVVDGVAESQILKFDNKGRFLLQLGRRGKSKGSNDAENPGQAADFFVYQKTNEVFVADGYGNRPDDSVPKDPVNDGPPLQQFTVVHKVLISRDGLVYVADRTNRRIQVFSLDGKFIREQFIARASKAINGTVSSLAFSTDAGQQFLYVADQGNNLVWILHRQTLAVAGSFGKPGRYAGQFNSPHGIATDSRGNLYLAEDLGGQRVQKFLFKGLHPPPKP